MAIHVPVPVKPFAHLTDTAGVPLDSLRPMIGAGDELRMGEVTLTNPASSLGEAIAISGFVPITPATHDYLHVDITGARFSLSVDDFILIDEASAGDTLSLTADPLTAKAAVNATTGETLLIGRTATNGVLIQRGTHVPASTQTRYELRVESYDAGVLHRRISPFQDHATRQVILQRRSAVQPAAPTNADVLSFDGTNVVLSENSEWKPIGIQTFGTDPLWLASITYQYHFTLTRWIRVGNWVVYPGSSTFRVQYASSESGPWVNTDPGTATLWVRYRLADGSWSTHQVRGLATTARQWRTVAIVTMASGVSATMEATPTIDLESVELLSITYQGDTSTAPGVQGTIIPTLVPGWMLRGTDLADGGLQQNSLLCVFDAITGGSAVRGHYMFANDTAYNDWRNAAHASEQRGHINLYGTVDASYDVNNVRIVRGYTGQVGVYVLRTI